MCLSKLSKRLRKGTGVGYKVFGVDGSYHLFFPYYGGRIKYDSWYEDKAEGKILADGDNYYPKGFHIFLSLQSAEGWRIGRGRAIRKVKYRTVVASGTQEGHPVVVTRELYIHRGKVEEAN